MIPDKIYVHTGAHLGLLTLTTIPVDAPGEQEYIRKDALLEWAKKKQYESLTIVADNFWQEVIDKLNKM